MQFLKIARITNTYALKGELKVQSLLVKYEKYLQINQQLFYYDQSQYTYEPLTITDVQKLQSGYLIKFKEFSHIDQVLFLKNQDLFCLTDEVLLEMDAKINHCLGFQVVNQETNVVIGQVVDYFTTKAHGIYVIQTTNNEEKMLADVPEFIINLSKRKKTLYVKVLSNW